MAQFYQTLYQNLVKNSESLDNLTQEQFKQTVESIKQLNQDEQNTLYLLIRYSANIDKDDSVYKCKFGKKSVLYDFETLTPQLQKVIYRFVIESQKKSIEPSVEIVFD